MHITRSDGSLCTLWTNRCVGRPAQRNMGERSISHSPHTTGARVEEGFKSSGLWPTQISRPSRNVARAAATRRAATQAAAERAAATTRRQRRRCCRRRCCRPNRRRRPGRTRTLRRQLRPKTAAEAETSAPEPPDAHHRSSRTPPDPLPPHTAAGREPSSPPAAARPATATPEKRATPPEPTTELTPPPELPPSPTKLSPPERSPLPKPNANRPAAAWAARAVRVSLSAVVSATTSSPRVSPGGRKMSKC
jgi:hypothetical protein